MACATSQVIARYDEAGKLVGLKLNQCSGKCADGATDCEGHRKVDPDDENVVVQFCACPEELSDNPLSREGLVTSCRISVLRKKPGLKPFGFACIGFCDDDEH